MARDSLYPVSVKAGKPILGMLPTGWQKLSLEKCLNIEARKAYIQDNQEYDLVTVKRSRGGVIRREHLKGKDISVKSQFYIKEGDFLISKRQIVHGACGLVPKELSGSIVSNEYCVLTGKSGFYLPYMEFLSESLYFQQTCFHSSIGVHIEKMIFKLDSWFKWPFNIPPLSEQKRIVKILSTWDKAISVTEKLLANSQQQKKALMQQLLTGKKRLLDENGVRFSGDWGKFTLSHFGKCIRGVSYKPENICENESDNTIRLLRSTNIQNGELNDKDLIILPKKLVKPMQVLMDGDLAICMANGSKSLVGKSAPYKPNDADYTVGAFCALFRPLKSVSSSFVKFLFESNQYQSQLLVILAGSSINNLKGSDIESINIDAPLHYKEQQKIASVLSAADAEISTLEKKLACLRDEKKALMQQLLTGKRRVKVDEAVAV